MRYDIQANYDLLTGATLVVKIPEDELDRKALYTILADKPNFILPFYYRSLEGTVEFVYHIGLHSKLRYLAGNRQSKEYAELWSGVLSPLLDCDDWFMKPYAFALNSEFLYFDKKKKVVSYVYIPSIYDCSDQGDLRGMAAEVSEMISVTDAVLENKVLRAILKKFNPQDFLKMLDTYTLEPPPGAKAFYMPAERGIQTEPHYVNLPPALPVSACSVGPTVSSVPAAVQPVRENAWESKGDIIIDIPAKGLFSKKKRESVEDGDRLSGKKNKENKSRFSIGSLFGRKKDEQQEADRVAAPAHTISAGSSVPGLIADYHSDRQLTSAASASASAAGSSDMTQIIIMGASGARLRCVGRTSLPQIIEVQIDESEIFTFGRYDAALGKQQSSFEFDKKTKAVSRRHAVIERSIDGYSITDLASSAGTFVDGQMLPPNTPCKLEKGSRVSFGNSGADYVWEE